MKRFYGWLIDLIIDFPYTNRRSLWVDMLLILKEEHEKTNK